MCFLFFVKNNNQLPKRQNNNQLPKRQNKKFENIILPLSIKKASNKKFIKL